MTVQYSGRISCLRTLSLSVDAYRQRGCPLSMRMHSWSIRYPVAVLRALNYQRNKPRRRDAWPGRSVLSRNERAFIPEPVASIWRSRVGEIFSGLEYLIHGSVFLGKPVKATFRHVPWKNNKDVLLYASCQIASSLTTEHGLAPY